MAKFKHLRTLVVTLMLSTFLLALVSGCAVAPYRPIDVKSLSGSGHIVFIPIGSISNSKLRELADYFQHKYAIKIETKSNMQIPANAYDPNRKQLIAEEIATSLIDTYRKPNNESSTILIGITSRDMYIRGMDWRYAFGYRDTNRNVAVLSNARMNDAFFGGPKTSKASQRSRLRKMTSKYIGLLYYRLPQSSDSRSVMYNSIMGPDDLDNMGEDF